MALKSPPHNIEGNWLATLEVGDNKLRILLKVEKSANNYTAKFDSLDQGATDLPIDSIVLDGNKLTFSAAKFGIDYEGTLNEKGDEISGTFKQGPGATPLVFRRTAEVAKLNRPQEPKKPYPYDEEEVSYRNEKDNIKIAGTLTLPRGGGKYPAVLLITGSGSQDRNETIAGHHPFLVLADHLTRNGIAVLRVDDRGVGGTDMGSLSVTSENYAEDVLAGVGYLKQRQEIDSKMIGPPTSTTAAILSFSTAATRSRIFPSSISSWASFCSAWNSSGCGNSTRVESPGSLLRSRTNSVPGSSTADPPLNLPTRSFGP